MESDEPLTIDGSYGEGGGQILRNSLALSMMTGKGIKIVNIRANRSNPGLRPQHLSAVRGAVMISNARVEGDSIKSQEIHFTPGRIIGGEHTIDIGTAGSVTLLLQCLLPPLLNADSGSTLILKGGTDVPWSPPVDYLRFVLFPLLRTMGAEIDCTLVRRGYFPKGGGEIRIEVRPSHLTCLDLTMDEVRLLGIEGKVFLTNLPDHISDRMIRSAELELRKGLGKDLTMSIERCEEAGQAIGTGITLWAVMRGEEEEDDDHAEGKIGESSGRKNGDARYNQRGRVSMLGSSMLGKRGIKAEEVGKGAALELIREIEERCAVDIHAGDQLPVFTPLIDPGRPGPRMHYTVREITPHLRTALWVLEQFGHPTSTLYRDGFHIYV